MSDTLASALIAMVVSGTAIAACTRTPFTTRTMRTVRTPRVRGGAGSSTGDSQMSTRDRIIALRDKLRAESRDLDTERELTAIAESISPTPPDYEARDLEDAALLGAPPDTAAAYHRETAVSTHEHARQRANHYDELARKAANPSHPDHVSAKQQTMYPHFAAEHKHARHDLAFREDDLERMEGRSEKRMRAQERVDARGVLKKHIDSSYHTRLVPRLWTPTSNLKIAEVARELGVSEDEVRKAAEAVR